MVCDTELGEWSQITKYVLEHSQNTTILARSGTLSINYMFRPLYWPSSGSTQLYKVTIQYMYVLGDEIRLQ
jgi:hypothetical protein